MHKAGRPLVISVGIVSFFLFLWRWYIVAIGGGILTAFLAYFFRDPERNITEDEKAIVSPADGQVVFLGLSPLGKDKMKKVSIFMSLFDVHVNRVPFDGEVKKIEYKKGKFLPCLLYTSPSPRDLSTSRMPSSA